MRPIVSLQDSLRYPLNEIIGTQSNVRLLRVLAIEVDGPLTLADAARRAGLTIPGAQKALRRLVQSGAVLRVGGGKKYQYEIHGSQILDEAVLTLFRKEKNRYEKLISDLKNAFENISSPPYAAWIEAFPKKPEEALELGFLHDTLHIVDTKHNLRIQLNRIEQNFDLSIEIVGYTKADLPVFEIAEGALLYGLSPFKSRSDRRELEGPRNHREREAWLKRLSLKLAEGIEKDASLVSRAKEHVDRLLQTDRGLATSDIKEWRDILETYSVPRLTRFITSSSERADRLRQSNPFFAVLSSDEKAGIVNGLEVNDDA